nr:MAG TPA: hypothetical protein [Caudoviricetes sp.]
MQQGHPRNKQLNRARHEMYLHNRHKSEGVWTAINNLMTGFSKAISVVGNLMNSALGVNKQMSAPKIEPDIKPSIKQNMKLNVSPLVDYDGNTITKLTSNGF